MNDTDIAYLAGLIDGEGSIEICTSVYKGRPSYSSKVRISNTVISVLEWIQTLFDGKIYISGPKDNVRKQCYTIMWNGENARPILEMVLPYLKIKDRQASIVLEFMDLVYVQNEFRGGRTPLSTSQQIDRQDLYLIARKLNRRGVGA